MSSFEIHTADSAPQGSRETLAQVQKSMGMVPNLMGLFAGSPAALNGYLGLSKTFDEHSSFNATERQVVLMTASTVNGCTYCVAAHSGIAKSQGVKDEVIAGLRNESALQDAKLEALASFTRSVVAERGHVSEDVVERFLAAGYDRRQVLEVVVGVGLKTISNYTNHIAKPPLDPAFQANAWARN